MVASEILDVVVAMIVKHELDVPKARRRDPRWLLRNVQIRNGALKPEIVSEIGDLCVAAIDSLEG